MRSKSPDFSERRSESRAAIPAGEMFLEEARGRRLAVVRELCRSGLGSEVLTEVEAGRSYFEIGRSYSLFLVADKNEARFPVHATAMHVEGGTVGFSLRRNEKTIGQIDRLLARYCAAQAQP